MVLGGAGYARVKNIGYEEEPKMKPGTYIQAKNIRTGLTITGMVIQVTERGYVIRDEDGIRVRIDTKFYEVVKS